MIQIFLVIFLFWRSIIFRKTYLVFNLIFLNYAIIIADIIYYIQFGFI